MGKEGNGDVSSCLAKALAEKGSVFKHHLQQSLLPQKHDPTSSHQSRAETAVIWGRQWGRAVHNYIYTYLLLGM